MCGDLSHVQTLLCLCSLPLWLQKFWVQWPSFILQCHSMYWITPAIWAFTQTLKTLLCFVGTYVLFFLCSDGFYCRLSFIFISISINMLALEVSRLLFWRGWWGFSFCPSTWCQVTQQRSIENSCFTTGPFRFKEDSDLSIEGKWVSSVGKNDECVPQITHSQIWTRMRRSPCVPLTAL